MNKYEKDEPAIPRPNAPAGELSSTSSMSNLCLNAKNPLFHVFKFISQEYGNNPDILLKRLIAILGLSASGSFIKNKKIKNALKLIEYCSTVGIFGSEIVFRIKKYIKSLQEPAGVYETDKIQVLAVLKVPETDFNEKYCELNWFNLSLPDNITKWLMSSPKATNFNILSYFSTGRGSLDGEKIKKLSSIDLSDENICTCGFIFKCEEKKFVFHAATIGRNVESKTTFLLDCKVYWLYSENFLSCISAEDMILKCFLQDYMKTLDIKNNFVAFESGTEGFVAMPKQKIRSCVNQYDVKKITSEIDWVLSHGKRRTYAFVGKQGTGKSSIIREIENGLSKYLIVHLNSEDFIRPKTLKQRFSVCKMFQPLLIVVEDLDSCGLKEKNNLTGTFLECIDDIDKSLNFVLIYSANDTSLINPTIINRPGRSDVVIEIFSPKTVKEATEVITFRLDCSKDKFEKEFKLEFNEKDLRSVAKRCVKEKFTQAEITNAIVEQALINIGLSVDKDTQAVIKGKQLSKYLSEAVKTQIQTRNAIKNCNFKNKDPNEYEDVKTCEEDIFSCENESPSSIK